MSTPFGRCGIELLKEVANHDRYTLPPYNEELMRQVMAEAKEHEEAGDKILEIVRSKRENPADADCDPNMVSADDWNSNPEDATAMVVHHEGVKRNKRLMLTYLMQRVERLKAIRWSRRFLPDDVAQNCSPQELDFYRAYDKVLSTYMGVSAKGIGLDLTVDEDPPIGARAHEMYHYHVLEDKGEMIFSFGRAGLAVGNQVQLPPDEAEPLVKEGVLKLVDYDHLGK